MCGAVGRNSVFLEVLTELRNIESCRPTVIVITSIINNIGWWLVNITLQ